jgi:hypothetical protein
MQHYNDLKVWYAFVESVACSYCVLQNLLMQKILNQMMFPV